MPIRSVSFLRKKGLLLLFALGGMLMVAVGSTLGLLYLQQQSSVTAAQDSAVWVTFQVEREVSKLTTALTLAAAGREPLTPEEMAQRFDVLYSITDVAERTSTVNKLVASGRLASLLAEVKSGIAGLTPTFDRLQDGIALSPPELEQVIARLNEIKGTTAKLLLLTNQEQGLRSASHRDELTFTYRLLGSAFVAFALTMMGAILILSEQLKAIEAAREQSDALGRELAEAAKAADAGNRAKSAFLATMSHEIRTPLNGVIGMVELLDDSDLTAQQRDKINAIRESGTMLVELINDILDFSKLESGHLDLEARSFLLGDVVDGVVDLVASRARDRGLELAAHYPDCTMVSDPTRLRQILINLLGNAVKFTSTGSVVLRASEVTDGKGRACIRFEVEDTGIGISREAMSRLFTEFTQVEASITRRFGGTGLGLAICRRLVRAMGGTIGVDSRSGSGSTFWFTLPIGDIEAGTTPAAGFPAIECAARIGIAAQERQVSDILFQEMIRRQVAPLPFTADAVPAETGLMVIDVPTARRLADTRPEHLGMALVIGFGAAEFARSARAALDGAFTSRRLTVLLRKGSTVGAGEPVSAVPADGELRQGRILVVEDNPVNQRVAQELLARLGQTVDVACDGSVAVEMARRTHYDLILMDMQMPVMDGIAATRVIRTLPDAFGQVAIVGLTANAFATDRAACLEAGMNGFQTKPVTRKKLVETLLPWLSSATPEAPLPTAEGSSMAIPESGGTEPAPDLFDTGQREQLLDALGEDVVAELTEAFWADANQLIDRASAALQAGETTDLLRILHTLKGSAANLGLLHIAASAETLRRLIPTTETPDLGPLLAAVLATRRALASPAEADDRTLRLAS